MIDPGRVRPHALFRHTFENDDHGTPLSRPLLILQTARTVVYATLGMIRALTARTWSCKTATNRRLFIFTNFIEFIF